MKPSVKDTKQAKTGIDKGYKKSQKDLRKAYRDAADKIVTEQVRMVVDNLRKQRNRYAWIVMFSVPLNIALAVVIGIMLYGGE